MQPLVTQPAIAISTSSLETLGNTLPVPRYDRSKLIPGIVHIGAGNFNRSHLAVYLDELLASGGSPRWSELGIGLMPPDEAVHAALRQQDFLYGVLERDTESQRYRVIGSLAGHLFAPGAPHRVIESMASADCNIISLTVTEGGYFLDAAWGDFLQDSAIQHDLENPATPSTWVGFVAAALEERMRRGGAPLTLLSCDNLHANGDAARTALLAFTALCSDRLSQWIEDHVTFPTSMVDRITPRTTEDDRVAIARDFGVQDLSPVVCEPFRQWVMEDNFAAGRPAWETLGVLMTSNVAAYEKTKMRLLNGGHFCIAYCAALLDIEFVADAVADPLLHNLLTAFLAETKATLVDLPGTNLHEYAATVVRRFQNAALRDQIPRICSGGTAKVGKFILPTLRDLLRAGRVPPVLSFVVASWLHFMRAHYRSDPPIALDDRDAGCLHAFFENATESAAIALADRSIFGDLAQHRALTAAVQQHLDNFARLGTRHAISAALAQVTASRCQ